MGKTSRTTQQLPKKKKRGNQADHEKHPRPKANTDLQVYKHQKLVTLPQKKKHNKTSTRRPPKIKLLIPPLENNDSSPQYIDKDSKTIHKTKNGAYSTNSNPTFTTHF